MGSPDAVILVCKLLIVEAKLIHEGGRHLLDLVLGESLGETGVPGQASDSGCSPLLTTQGACSCVVTSKQPI